MNRSLPIILLAVALGAPAAAQFVPKAAENPKAVLPAPRRAEALKSAGEMLAPRSASWKERVADLPDPFFRRPSASAVPAPEVQPRRPTMSDADLLRTRLAPQVNPTGIFVVGDDSSLLLDGKRVKVGDLITIPFDGAVYQVRVTSIQRNSYSLRLNDHELQREFK